MHTTISGGSIRPANHTADHRLAAAPARVRKDWPALLSREVLRHLVAEMVD